ncbi:hypothetical protein NXS98_07600 [Fontisphaera persica]|uniref:RHS repeat-associated core domain-containing protein n=1 Tax=Fontisphaera persica TaxID=2974023 RepID=UPI0024BFD070|nr:RHS repeat-associated core domain-containing protein [Fontisphaera persica]WCJ60974.1 hypothetical protein NXS98_07600 [Fontisphaera persica]
MIHNGPDAGVYFPVYDGNGNVVGLVNGATGAWAAEYEYGPFGEPIRATGPVALVNPFRFSTKFCDDETGQYYYGHRYYHPHTGRWLSRDPIGEGGGLNLYGLVNNQPVHFVDPHGLWGIKIGRVHLGWGEPTYVFDREVWQEIKERWHTGLDAIGVIEPTPLADGLNALLYAMEGGWGNAGISAVGMVPFLGDGAKLCKYIGKYGAKAAERGLLSRTSGEPRKAACSSESKRPSNATEV